MEVLETGTLFCVDHEAVNYLYRIAYCTLNGTEDYEQHGCFDETPFSLPLRKFLKFSLQVQI